jgi:plasmid stabilization system protein ParE
MRVVFVPQAQVEILEAAAYYRERSADAASRFSSNLSALIELLQQFPRIGSPVSPQVRRVLLKKFAYQLIYRIEGDEIRVYAVAHLKRKPRYWKDRLP